MLCCSNLHDDNQKIYVDFIKLIRHTPRFDNEVYASHMRESLPTANQSVNGVRQCVNIFSIFHSFNRQLDSVPRELEKESSEKCEKSSKIRSSNNSHTAPVIIFFSTA